jgi:RHS repeat-associated protein
MLTSSASTREASSTYDAYSNTTSATCTAKHRRLRRQYTGTDTGLIYSRARVYNPATAQFLSVDPKVEETNAVYEYAKDDPLADSDPTGDEGWGSAEREFSYHWEQDVNHATAALTQQGYSDKYIDEFSEVADYYRWLGLYNLTLQGEGTVGGVQSKAAEMVNKTGARLYAKIFREFAVLDKAEDVGNWKDVLEEAASLFEHIAHAKGLYKPFRSLG